MYVDIRDMRVYECTMTKIVPNYLKDDRNMYLIDGIFTYLQTPKPDNIIPTYVIVLLINASTEDLQQYPDFYNY
jgi:hypothetical protein